MGDATQGTGTMGSNMERGFTTTLKGRLKKASGMMVSESSGSMRPLIADPYFCPFK